MLEPRSPASSLIDAAVFGLLPGDPALPDAVAAVEPRSGPAPLVELPAGRGDLRIDPATSSAAATPAESSSPTVRRTEWDDEPVVVVGRPHFGLLGANATWMDRADSPADASATPGTDGPAAAGGAEVTPAMGATPPGVTAAAAANGGSSGWGDPPGGGDPPPGDGGGGDPGGGEAPPTHTVPEQVMVQEVDFLGNTTRVVQDPGRTPYPDGPEYLDNNADGVIDNDAQDRCLPVTYKQGDRVRLTAKFRVKQSSTVIGNRPDFYVSGQAYTFSIPLTKLTAAGDVLELAATSSTGPLPGFVHTTGSISWTFYRIVGNPPADPSGLQGSPAGFNANTLYVTLAKPVTTSVYHTVIHTSTVASTWATTPQEVVDNTYEVFETRTIHAVVPAYLPDSKPEYAAGGAKRKLNYYLDWDVNSQTTDQLLELGDGQCSAWARFFRDTLNVHGNIGGEGWVVQPINPVLDEWFLIRKWGYLDPGTSGSPTYPYLSVVPPSDRAFPSNYWRKKDNGDWDHVWEANSEVNFRTSRADTAGRGQGETVPRALFSNHALVWIDGKLYDPSYGTGPFQGSDKGDEDGAVLAWENGSVSGFGRLFQRGGRGGKDIIIARINDNGTLDTKHNGFV